MVKLPTNLLKDVFEMAFKGYTTSHHSFEEFLSNTINGDEVKNYIVFDAKNQIKEDVIILYILTNLRLIKVVIKGQAYQSYATFLNQIIGGVNRTVKKDSPESQEIVSLFINFKGGNFGLTYTIQDNKAITDFFQEVDSSVHNLATK